MGIEIVGGWQGNPEEGSERVGSDVTRKLVTEKRRHGGKRRRHHGSNPLAGGKKPAGIHAHVFRLSKVIRHMAKKGSVKGELITKWAALKVKADAQKPAGEQHDQAYWTSFITQKIKSKYPNVVLTDDGVTAPGNAAPTNTDEGAY